ncbi:MAG: zf-TFIIB domain-containing protein [Planctomycetes bacterium]|nr:zf-TFIIB domain-containing protein [Planctomycetota bacterium]
MTKITCKSCNNIISSKIKYSPFCGAESKKRETVISVPICARCKIATEKYFYRDTELDICPTCKGIWFDL